MFFAFCFSSSLSLFSWCKRYYLPFLLPFLERSLDPWCLESFLIVVAGGGCKDVLASVGYLARDVSNAELEKPCSRWCLFSLFWIISHFLYSGLSPRHLDCLLFSWDSKYGLWTSSICISQEFVEALSCCAQSPLVHSAVHMCPQSSNKIATSTSALSSRWSRPVPSFYFVYFLTRVSKSTCFFS